MKHDNAEVLSKLNKRCAESPPLTDKERLYETILRLRLEEGLRHKQVAERLNLKVGTAAAYFSFARRWIENL